MYNRINDTIKRLFPNEFDEFVPEKIHWWEKIDWSVLKSGWHVWLIYAVIAIQVILSVYFFNKFVTLETRLLTDKAQVEAQLQRRKDLIINLSKTVVDYAEHERKMFIYMADKRATSIDSTEKIATAISKGGELKGTENLIDILKKSGLLNVSKAPKGEIEGAIAKLLAVAESYPDLKLSANFQKLMDSLINMEDKIVDQRMVYNNACNEYGTYIRKFPQNIFAFVFGFGKYPFIEVDKDVDLFDRVEY